MNGIGGAGGIVSGVIGGIDESGGRNSKNRSVTAGTTSIAIR